MISFVVSSLFDEGISNYVPGDCATGDEKSGEEEGDYHSCVCGVPVADYLCEAGLVDDGGVGTLVGAEPASEEVVISVDSEAVDPAEDAVVGCPGHLIIIINPSRINRTTKSQLYSLK